MLHKKDKIYKEYLKLERRLNELYRLSRKLPLIKLENPYQRGWVIFYELRKASKNKPDAAKIERAIKLGYRKEYTRSISHVKNVRRGTNVKNPIIPGRKSLELKNIPEELRRYFVVDPGKSKWFNRVIYRISISEHLLYKRVKPNIVEYEVDTTYDAEIDKIRNEMSSNKFLKFYYRNSSKKRFNSSQQRMLERDRISKFKKGEKENVDIENHKRVSRWWD